MSDPSPSRERLTMNVVQMTKSILPSTVNLTGCWVRVARPRPDPDRRFPCVRKEMQMPRKLPFDAAVASLHQLVEGMVPGEELVLTVQGEPKAIVTRPARASWPCQPGTAKDAKHWMAPDFDAPLEDFAEYME
jgi:hypothetical protein